VFAAEVKEHLLWEVVRYQRAARRAGTACVKERNEVHRTGAKLFKQKGTGNARHGSRRANIFRGGGSVHGPKPRSYAFHVNKKVRAGALRSALSLRAKAGDLLVVRDLALPVVKTKALARLPERGGRAQGPPGGRRREPEPALSARNLATSSFLDVRGVNVYDILRFPKLVISETSLRQVESRLLGRKQEQA
jgi:large subunit ribosomal protein L4